MNDPLMSPSGDNDPASLARGPDTVSQALDAVAPAVSAGPVTAGSLIRAAREARGLDLASLAAILKIPPRRLEALEQGRHAELQGPTFERALAQATCRVLKIDAQPVLALLPQHVGNTLERVTEGINTPFRDRQASSVFDRGTLDWHPALIVPTVIFVAALALFYVPTDWWARLTHASADRAAASAATPVAGNVAAGVSTSAVAAAAVPASASAFVDTAAMAAAASAPANSSSNSSATTAATAAPVLAANGVDEVLAHAEAVPSIPLQVVATADSWVEVIDAQGRPLLSRTVVAGESVGLDGALPMHVKIGNASGTRLTLRGDNVDLTPWTRDNVARLELK